MYKYVKIKIKRKKKIYKNFEFLTDIVWLLRDYSKFLNDDFSSDKDIVEQVVSQIERCNGFFWVVLDENSNFMGVIFLDNLIGSFRNLFSAEVSTCFKKEYWGAHTQKCGKQFIKYCFKNLGLRKLKATIFPNNFRVKGLLKALGFVYEATLKAETIRDGKLQDIDIYSILKER